MVPSYITQPTISLFNDNKEYIIRKHPDNEISLVPSTIIYFEVF